MDNTNQRFEQPSPEQYEEKRQIVNNMLKVFLSDSCKIHFWKHLRLMNSPLRIFGEDGVHLTMQGARKCYRSLRLAVACLRSSSVD